jgi:hypothetical protein
MEVVDCKNVKSEGGFSLRKCKYFRRIWRFYSVSDFKRICEAVGPMRFNFQNWEKLHW